MSFSLASSSSLPGSGHEKSSQINGDMRTGKDFTGIEERNLAGIGLPEILTLI